MHALAHWALMRFLSPMATTCLTSDLSMERLGEAVQEILNSSAYQQLIPKGSTTETWINTYPERHVH